MTLRDRRIWAILGLAGALCVTGSIEVWAQETIAGPAGACPDKTAPFVDPLNEPHWNRWGVDPSQHRFQPSAMAGLAAKDVPRLELKWAFGFPGVARSIAQPTIVGGRAFIGSQGGKVYSLDASSGCTYWEFDAGKSVRSAVVVGPSAGG
jgi:polyvinyl alcohol dehydrogenase (cytochrome)